MKRVVLLYNPKAVFFDMPLALMAIGSALDSNLYKVIIVDGRIEERPIEIIKRYIDQAVCFGVTVLTGSPIKDALHISSEVKKLRQDLPVIWGGWHPSLFPTQTLVDEADIDITVQGQGEETFQELVHALANNKSLENVKGICYRNGQGEVVKNPMRSMQPMDLYAEINYE